MCRLPLSPTARADARFCTAACRQQAARDREQRRRPPAPTPTQLATQALDALEPWQRRRAVKAALMDQLDTGKTPREVAEVVEADRWKKDADGWVSTFGARVSGQQRSWTVAGLDGVTLPTLTEAKLVGSQRAYGWFADS